MSRPGHPIDTAQAFGEHWLALARSIHESASELGAFLLWYEDFIAPDYDVSALEAHLGAEIDREALRFKVSGHPPSGPSPGYDPGQDLDELERVVGSYASALGYRRS